MQYYIFSLYKQIFGSNTSFSFLCPSATSAPRLHQVLEQLYTALKAWESSVKASTTLTGSFQPDRDYRQDERAVNVASIAFEEFHAKLGDVETNFCACQVVMVQHEGMQVGYRTWKHRIQQRFLIIAGY